VAAAVLSGNRNFEGRIHPQVQANFLASPPLVVAYALAGTVDIDLQREPLGIGKDGDSVYLSDIWPSQDEVKAAVSQFLKPEMFREQYGHVFDGNRSWNEVAVPEGEIYEWNSDSTYIQDPPFFTELTPQVPPLHDITGAKVLALLGDSITTDHISPASSIALNSPAGRYLIDHGVPPSEFNQYGARRGNHEVMMRGTFANIRLKNRLLPGVEGGVTEYQPTGERMSIYDAAMAYGAEGTPLIVIAGKEYGTGSSRDWAAKGPYLLGVKAVIAESFERIHRSNLVGMGVLPLQFKPGEDQAAWGLTGLETYDILGIAGDDGEGLQRGKALTVRATSPQGPSRTFEVICRIDTPVELHYYRNGGILHSVLRDMLKRGA
jgi:aconitate hydratase